MTYLLRLKYYTNMDTKKHTKNYPQNIFKNQYFLEKLTMKNFNKLVKTLAVSTLGLGIVTASISEAKAASLVPTQEGEIKLDNLACLTGDCIDTNPLGYTVKSLEYKENYDESLLFVDDSNTKNDYGFGITFKGDETEDAGTNSDNQQFWFRPVAFQGGEPLEDGQLEVGLFEFTFENTANEIILNFFDVEDSGVTGVTQVNGTDVEDLLLEGGDDGNTQTIVLTDVDSFVIQLGNIDSPTFSNTGDGVLLQASVPESETTIALGVLGVAGMLTLKRRKRASQKA